MRIGIDARLWDETGIGRYTRNLVMHLAELDTKNNEYFIFLKKKQYQQLVTPGNNFRKKLADVHWHTLQEQTLFLQLLNKEKLDLVHFPYFSFPILYKHPFVITIHDLILFHYPTGTASKLPKPLYATKLFVYKQLMHHAAKQAKKIITVSNATKQEIMTQLHVDSEKIVVTYEGADLGMQHAASNIQKKFNLHNPYFLYVGNAYPHKNLEKLLKAFTEFRKEISQVDIILVGKSDYFYDELKRLLYTFELENTVKILHNVSDEELVELYKNAIALVMPSLMEGFGLPALEAMANNCLVVASAIPSLQEICQDAAVYFDPMNRDDLVKTLKKVYFEQVTFTKNKILGLERSKVFSWKTMAEETLRVYNAIPATTSLPKFKKKL